MLLAGYWSLFSLSLHFLILETFNFCPIITILLLLLCYSTAANLSNWGPFIWIWTTKDRYMDITHSLTRSFITIHGVLYCPDETDLVTDTYDVSFRRIQLQLLLTCPTLFILSISCGLIHGFRQPQHRGTTSYKREQIQWTTCYHLSIAPNW